jgi:hypothetical protein
MPVSWNDLLLAYDFVNVSAFGEHKVFLCTGMLHSLTEILSD